MCVSVDVGGRWLVPRVFCVCVCVFFFSSVNAKKGEGTKTHLKKICACARVRGEERECPRFLHGAPPSFFPTLCKSQRWQEQQWRRRRLW